MKEHQELVRQLRNGDEQAAVRLVGRYGERLYQAARQLCGNEADARDLMSETIERAFFGIAAFREEAALFSWLYGILLNVRRMKARKDRRSPVIYVARLPEVEEEGAEVGQAFFHLGVLAYGHVVPVVVVQRAHGAVQRNEAEPRAAAGSSSL